MPATRKPTFATLGDLLDHLGGIPPHRVCFDPVPGTATRRDLIRLHARNDKLYELVDRTLVEKPLGSPEAFLAAELIFVLRTFLAKHDLGFLYAPDALIQLRPGVIRGPDVCFVSWKHCPGKVVPATPIVLIRPDLVIEILSPSNTPGEIDRKLADYFQAGVERVWVIDPIQRQAHDHATPDQSEALTEATGVLHGGAILPGFAVPLRDLFARLGKPTPRSGRRKQR